ncbi:MAG: preprotein translocase subunit SecY [Lachnospiraceae bacterium]|nr:preprotein translocase subunit SecY [Lachnospiraceae bacterium]
MIKTLQNALRVKDIRNRLLFTFLMILVIRFGSQLPVPGTDPSKMGDFWSKLKAGDAFNFLSAVSGGSYENFSVLALGISPYITSSIIVQLLTIAIPKLEELQKGGQEGRKKIQELTRYVTVILALIQATAMSIGFGNRGLFLEEAWFNVPSAVFCLTAGSAFLMWIGERITQNGIGNGISVVLLVNILSGLPDDLLTIYNSFMLNKSVAVTVVIAVFVVAVLAAIVAFAILLNQGERRIPVQYAQKVVGRRSVGGRSSHIPIKANTAGVIPVIFTSSLLSLPTMVTQFVEIDPSSVGARIIAFLNSGNWFRPSVPYYSLGAVLYIAMIIAFAYFYTSITFNPMEIADNMKKSGGFIPGIRPGKPTSDYLTNTLNHMVIIGALGLTVIAIFPMILTGVFNVGNLSLLGTSLLIIVGVIIETLKSIEAKMVAREYESIF